MSQPSGFCPRLRVVSRRVPEAFSIPSLKYDEAMELAYFGAQVGVREGWAGEEEEESATFHLC